MARLLELFPEAVEDLGLVTRAVELGLLVTAGEEFEAPSPLLLRVGAELVAAGVPLAAALDEYERLAADATRIAGRFVALFEDHVWEPYVAAGMPAERLAEVTDALQRMRPTAGLAMEAALAQAMERAVAESTARQVARFLPLPTPATDVPAPATTAPATDVPAPPPCPPRPQGRRDRPRPRPELALQAGACAADI